MKVYPLPHKEADPVETVILEGFVSKIGCPKYSNIFRPGSEF